MVVPKELNIRDRKFLYEDCNLYQKVIYKQIALKLDTLKVLKADYEQTKSNETKILIHKGVGVIEYFIERFDVLGNYTLITNLYELEQAREKTA